MNSSRDREAGARARSEVTPAYRAQRAALAWVERNDLVAMLAAFALGVYIGVTARR